MSTATALFRKSEFHSDPVICAVFVDENAFSRKSSIEEWKDSFKHKFPEFQNSTFIEIDVDLI